LNIKDTEIPAICDINIDNLSRAQKLVEDSGKNRPEGYSKGEEESYVVTPERQKEYEKVLEDLGISKVD
jgi:hypothetical protein